MNDYQQALEDLKTKLAAQAPARVVTRELKDWSQRERADLEAGVLTVVGAGIRSFPDGNSERIAEDGRQVIQIIGQIVLPENATGEQVEAAEWALFDDVVATLKRTDLPGPIQLLYPGRLQLSQQLERPYGWIGFELENHVITD